MSFVIINQDSWERDAADQTSETLQGKRSHIILGAEASTLGVYSRDWRCGVGAERQHPARGRSDVRVR